MFQDLDLFSVFSKPDVCIQLDVRHIFITLYKEYTQSILFHETIGMYGRVIAGRK